MTTNRILIILGVIVLAVVAGLLAAKGATILNQANNSSPSPIPTLEAVQSPSPTVSPEASSSATKALVIDLAAQNSSESGKAVLMEQNGKVVVQLALIGAPKDTPQPAHIHVGKCPNVGAVKYPLTNVVNGKSETTLNVDMATLLSQLPLGINVHKSVPQVSVYVSCGDLKS